MTSFGRPFAAAAPGSNISAASTLKKFPKTLFIAMKAAAVPPEVPRNWRRLTPSFFAALVASASSSAATCFCACDCGMGMYSPFEISWVGIGDGSSTS
jgi:hypothetical protein